MRHKVVILFQIREQWDYNNRLWQTRIRTISKELENATEGLQYTIFEFMQTMMDYIEDNFEMVMIPPTPGELTLCRCRVSSFYLVRLNIDSLQSVVAAKHNASLRETAPGSSGWFLTILP